MKIGIDVSQIAHEGTGVGEYVKSLVENLLRIDKENEYVLFYSSLRKKFPAFSFSPKGTSYNIAAHFQISKKVTIKQFKLPPSLLVFLWNRLHIMPIEMFIGDVDIFISSDWTQPPTRKAKKVTILYDLIVYKHPQETAEKIVSVQKRRLQWVKKECHQVICISEATKRDAIDILEIPENRLKVIYPGIV